MDVGYALTINNAGGKTMEDHPDAKMVAEFEELIEKCTFEEKLFIGFLLDKMLSEE